jgi:hypothetical protein
LCSPGITEFRFETQRLPVKSFGNALDRFHDKLEYRLPMPARYVIDKEGIIRLADVNADYAIRPEPSETVNVLRALKPWRTGLLSPYRSVNFSFLPNQRGICVNQVEKSAKGNWGSLFLPGCDKFDPHFVGLQTVTPS